MNPSRTGYQAAQIGPYVDRLRAALTALPGVTHSGIVALRPLDGRINSTEVHIPGSDTAGAQPVGTLVHSASDGLIETLGLSLIAGRTLEPRDMHSGSSIIVVDELLAQRLFPNENPIGRSVSFGEGDANQREIVGVVSSSRYDSLRRPMMPTVYRPWIAGDCCGINVALRTSVDPRAIFGAVRHTVATIDASVPIEQIDTQTALIDRLLRNERLLSILSNAFAIVALVLAGVGLAGLLIYSATRHTNEIGARIALGAAPRQVAKMVLGDSLWLVIAGIIAGLPCAYAVARLLRGTLFDLQPADPVSAGVALSTLLAVAGLAAWLPARRAAGIDPIAALREE